MTATEVSDPDLGSHRLIGMAADRLRSTPPDERLGWDRDEMEPMSVKARSLDLWIEDGVVRDVHVQW